MLEMLEMLEGLDGWKCWMVGWLEMLDGWKCWMVKWSDGWMVGYHITGALQVCLPRLETAGPDANVVKSINCIPRIRESNGQWLDGQSKIHSRYSGHYA